MFREKDSCRNNTTELDPISLSYTLNMIDKNGNTRPVPSTEYSMLLEIQNGAILEGNHSLYRLKITYGQFFEDQEHFKIEYFKRNVLIQSFYISTMAFVLKYFLNRGV